MVEGLCVIAGGNAERYSRPSQLVNAAFGGGAAQAPTHLRWARRQHRVALSRQLLFGLLAGRAVAFAGFGRSLTLRQLPAVLEFGSGGVASVAHAVYRPEDLPDRAVY